MECFRLLFGHLARNEHQFLSGTRDSRKARSLWGIMRGVGGVRKSIHQSWLAKELGLLCWGFKGVQEEILSEEASTLQIGSVAFPPGQYTSPQLPIVQTLVPVTWLFPKLIDMPTQEVFRVAFQKLLERYNKCIAAWGDYFEGDKSFMCVLSIKVTIRKKSGNLLYAPHTSAKKVRLVLSLWLLGYGFL